MNLSVIVTQEDDKTLGALIKKLNRNPGYDNGIEVIQDENLPGKYSLELHDGLQTKDISNLRVYQGKIILGKAQEQIENLLKENKINYKVYKGISNSIEANSEKPNIRIPN